MKYKIITMLFLMNNVFSLIGSEEGGGFGLVPFDRNRPARNAGNSFLNTLSDALPKAEYPEHAETVEALVKIKVSPDQLSQSYLFKVLEADDAGHLSNLNRSGLNMPVVLKEKGLGEFVQQARSARKINILKFLIGQGIDPNSDEFSLLADFARNGDLVNFNYFLTLMLGTINAPHQGRRALSLALDFGRSGHEDLASKDPKNYAEIAQLLCAVKANVNLEDDADSGMSPIFLALQAKELKDDDKKRLVKALVDAGTNLEQVLGKRSGEDTPDSSVKPLGFALLQPHCPGVISLLLENGAAAEEKLHANDPRPVDETGPGTNVILSPLIIAVQSQNFGALDEILNSGKITNIHVRDKDGNTSLHHALFNDIQFIETLLRAGASPFFPNKAGESSLVSAVKLRKNDLLSILTDGLKVGDIEEHRYLGKTLLQVALESGNKDAFDFFLSRINNLYSTDEAKNTVLHRAAQLTHVDAVAKIIERAKVLKINADDCGINFLNQEKDEQGNIISSHTPLHIAIKKGSLAIVQIFIKFGAETNIPDKDSNNALLLAWKEYVQARKEDKPIRLEIFKTVLQKCDPQERAEGDRYGKSINKLCQPVSGMPTDDVSCVYGTGADLETLKRCVQNDDNFRNRTIVGSAVCAVKGAGSAVLNFVWGSSPQFSPHDTQESSNDADNESSDDDLFDRSSGGGSKSVNSASSSEDGQTEVLPPVPPRKKKSSQGK